jgi:hypothetical protein
MSKLKLDINALAVDSFTIPAARAGVGTIQGAQASLFSCPPAEPTKCTAPCMSGFSRCDMLSCGSTCALGGC